MIDPAAIVELINHRHGTAYRLLRRADGGESGVACVIADDDGEYILKFGEGSEFRVREPTVITERLRAKGYPAPELVIASGNSDPRYLVQRILPGRPNASLTPPLLNRVIELNRLQADVAVDLPQNWPAAIVESIELGFKDWCVHDSLLNYSDETRALLEELKHTAANTRGEEARTSDAVHFDFTMANILVEDGDVSAVIDWSGCCAGDRAFDLVTLAFYAMEDTSIANLLLKRACEISGRETVALYVAHMILRQVDWSIRHHDERTIARYLGISRRVMRKIQDLRERPGDTR